MSEEIDDTADRLGSYVLVERIAQGGMAELFLAKKTGAEGFEKVLAVKRILPELSSHEEFVSMFINEAKIAARLNHPNIAQIFDFGRVDDFYFIAMEYVHGENLRRILQRAAEKNLSLPPDLCAAIIAKTCAALEHAHRKTDERGRPLHIVHRDVSPQNVLVSFEGEVKVVDFGIAKAVAENPEATRGVIKGKLAYLSPEQVMGQNLDGRSDVFAAGVLMYELLTGNRLFSQAGSGEILDAIVKLDSTAAAKSIPNLPPKLRTVLEGALRVDREKRIRSAGEMQRALEAYLRERGDVGGTFQLQSLMKLLFDEQVGEHTLGGLRRDLLGSAATGRPGGNQTGLRLVAAAAGALLGAAALWAMQGEDRGPRVDPTPLPTLPPATAGPTVPPTAAPTVAPTAAPTVVPTISPGAESVTRAERAIGAGDSAAAVEAFEEAFERDPALREAHAPDYAAALTADGRRLLEEGQEGAADRFRAALTVAPDLFEPHFMLGNVLTREGRIDEAMEEYLRALEINPDSPDARFNLGFLYVRQEKFREAVDQYEKASQLDPAYPEDVFYNLSVCYERLGDEEAALGAVERGLERVPDSETLRARKKQLTE